MVHPREPIVQWETADELHGTWWQMTYHGRSGKGRQLRGPKPPPGSFLLENLPSEISSSKLFLLFLSPFFLHLCIDSSKRPAGWLTVCLHVAPKAIVIKANKRRGSNIL